MTNSLEGNPRQPIRDLVPRNLSLESRSLEGIKELPHLQRVAGLVYLLLEGKRRFWQDSDQQLNKETEIVNSDWTNLALSLRERNKKGLPKIIADKLQEHGDPFGFGLKATRAILEMANEMFETELYCNSVSTHDPEWNPDPRDYLQEVMIRMFEEGMLSGITPFSQTEFPAGDYHREIFPRPVAQQMEKYIKQIYS